MTVAEFIEWWQGLTGPQRREEIARARERKAYWRERRARVLFGLLEEDSMFGILNQSEAPPPYGGEREDE